MGQFFEFVNRTKQQKNKNPIPQSNGATWYPKFDYAPTLVQLEVFETIAKLNGWTLNDELEAVGDSGTVINYRKLRAVYLKKVALSSQPLAKL